MTSERISSRSTLVKYLQRDYEFELFGTKYIYNGYFFTLNGSGYIDFGRDDEIENTLHIESVDERWLMLNCTKPTKKEKTAKIASRKQRIDNSSRLKPKIKRDFKFMKWLIEEHQPRCFACGGFCGIELHHVKRVSSDPKDDHCVIPLCGDSCHRLGNIMSAHGTPVKFRTEYPIEIQKKFADSLYQIYKDAHG